jgi:hypothetical protein
VAKFAHTARMRLLAKSRISARTLRREPAADGEAIATSA